ncbi:MAG: HAD family phosphatase [Oscillospiraceae bacterium]|nr:HAD family phosphatase [Oscillospiraceae bacterium]
MFAVLLDFNGTMFFDASLHLEAWSKVYQELYPEKSTSPDARLFCGPRNDEILRNMAPWLTDRQREFYSEMKEELYRLACVSNSEITHLVNGTQAFLRLLQEKGVPFGLASASIEPNIDFFFETFALGQWFRREDVVFDDGTYSNKGAMHLEAARRLGVYLADCLVIEDSLSSVRQARQNGAGRIVGMCSVATDRELLAAGADYTMDDFTQFDPAWLDRDRPNPR